MTKEELLQELSNKITSGEISRQELEGRFSLAPGAPVASNLNKENPHFSVTKMLYVLGAAIVVIGIIIFVHQIWDEIGSAGRIGTTLGLGILLTFVGVILSKQKPADNIGPVFSAIGGMLIPGGAVVTLSELSINTVSPWPVTFTFGAILLFYLFLNSVQKNAVMTFFAITNGTAFVYLLTQALVGGSFYMQGDLYAYLTMVIGVSYLLLAYSFREGWTQPLTGFLYFFGTLGLLGAAFSRVFSSVPWQMLFFFLVIGGLFLSATVKSRAILVISTLFLIAHVSYITGKYFADSIGWPVALIFLGFVFIALGYVSIAINKKYIKS